MPRASHLPQGTTGKENGGFPFPKASYSFPLALMLTDGSHSSFRGFSVPLPAPGPAVAHQQPCSVPSFVSRTRNQAAPLHGCCTASLPPHTRQYFSGIIRAPHGAEHPASAPRPAAGIAHRGCHHCPVSSNMDARPWRSYVEDPSASGSF